MRSHFQVGLLLALWLLGALVVAAWLYQAHYAAWKSALGLLSVAVGAVCVAQARNSPVGQFLFDGSEWRWAPQGAYAEPEAGRLQILLDLQNRLLLGFERINGRRSWFWLAQSAQPERWMDVRRALVASARGPVAPPRRVNSRASEPLTPGEVAMFEQMELSDSLPHDPH